MGWWELGFMEKEKLRLDMGAKGGQPFLLRDIVLFLPLFFIFYFFNFSTPKHGANLEQYQNKNNNNCNNTNTTRIGGNEDISFTGIHTAKGGTGGNYLGEISLLFFLAGEGATRIGNFANLGSTRGEIPSTLVRMKLDMTGLIVLFRLIFWICFSSTSRLLLFWSTFVFLFSHWFILTKSACF